MRRALGRGLAGWGVGLGWLIVGEVVVIAGTDHVVDASMAVSSSGRRVISTAVGSSSSGPGESGPPEFDPVELDPAEFVG